MNNLPDELILHLFTYINVYSSQLKPLIEINKRIRKILYYNKYTLKEYPCCYNESVACICNSFLTFVKYIEKQKREAEEFSMSESFILNMIDEDIDNEIYEELNYEDMYLHNI